MSDFPNRLFIFPQKGVKKKDWKGRDNIIFTDLCAQTIPQNRYVAEREYININAVWHDISEKPKDGSACLVEVEIEAAEELSSCTDYVESWYNEKLGWSTDYLSVLDDSPGVSYEIKKWAYIADLLPKGGEYAKDYSKNAKGMNYDILPVPRIKIEDKNKFMSEHPDIRNFETVSPMGTVTI